MEIRKLFQVLVLGGAALTVAHCGGADGSENTTPPPSSTGQPPSVQGQNDAGTLPDGGLPDGGLTDGGGTIGGGGGPRSW